MSRVFGLQGWGEPHAAYEQMGAETKDALLRLLPDDWSFEGKRVLDFGCGSGRTLRHFLREASRGSEFWGADIDGPSIDWLKQALSPPLHPWKCAPGPPIGLEPCSFDLIWAISVFTHLPRSASFQWLLELHRLLKPDAYLIATYSGRWNSEFLIGEEWDDDRIGMAVLQQHRTWDEGGPVVLMSDWWVQAHWGRAFEIVGRLERFHSYTWVLMRKRDVELTPEDLERPDDDPREHKALRENVRLLQHEVLDHAEQLRRVEATIRGEYENSLSWRLTTPLREAKARLTPRSSKTERASQR